MGVEAPADTDEMRVWGSAGTLGAQSWELVRDPLPLRAKFLCQ